MVFVGVIGDGGGAFWSTFFSKTCTFCTFCTSSKLDQLWRIGSTFEIKPAPKLHHLHPIHARETSFTRVGNTRMVGVSYCEGGTGPRIVVRGGLCWVATFSVYMGSAR